VQPDTRLRGPALSFETHGDAVLRELGPCTALVIRYRENRQSAFEVAPRARVCVQPCSCCEWVNWHTYNSALNQNLRLAGY